MIWYSNANSTGISATSIILSIFGWQAMHIPHEYVELYEKCNANSVGISVSTHIDMCGSDNRYGKRDD
jgi:hypothetical protein